MTDLSHTQALDSMRATIAAKTAAYEAEFGPIETLPIYIGERPQPSFTVSVPGKPKAHQQSRELRRADHERAAKNATRKKRNQDRVDTVRRMAGTGSTIEQMAEAVKITRNSLMRLMRENNIVRGPKMNLEA